jgi:hypothetical protein
VGQHDARAVTSLGELPADHHVTGGADQQRGCLGHDDAVVGDRVDIAGQRLPHLFGVVGVRALEPHRRTTVTIEPDAHLRAVRPCLVHTG